MFERLVLPLKQNRSIDLPMDFAEETATSFRPLYLTVDDIDIMLLEGIFIFKREFAPLFDLKIWIECTFEMALALAFARGQENPSPIETVAAYESIYIPAQRVHFERNEPKRSTEIIFENN